MARHVCIEYQVIKSSPNSGVKLPQPAVYCEASGLAIVVETVLEEYKANVEQTILLSETLRQLRQRETEMGVAVPLTVVEGAAFLGLAGLKRIASTMLDVIGNGKDNGKATDQQLNDLVETLYLDLDAEGKPKPVLMTPEEKIQAALILAAKKDSAEDAKDLYDLIGEIQTILS